MTGKHRSALLADLLLVAAAGVWGATFVVVREGLRDASPLVFVAVRFTTAALLVLPAVALRAGWPDRTAWSAGWRVGLPLGAGFALQTVGLQWTPPGRAAFLTGLFVVLVPVLAPLAGLPSGGGRAWAGVGLAAAGTAVLAWPAGLGHGTALGDLCMLACAVAFAIQVLAVDAAAARVPPATLLAVEVTVVALAAWPAVLLLEEPRLRTTPEAVGALAVTALLATVGAFWAQNWAQARTGATRAAIVFALEPVFAAATSWLLTGEELSPLGLAGAALILAGMVVCGRARASGG